MQNTENTQCHIYYNNQESGEHVFSFNVENCENKSVEDLISSNSARKVSFSEKEINCAIEYSLDRRLYTPIKFSPIICATKYNIMGPISESLHPNVASGDGSADQISKVEKFVHSELVKLLLFHWPHNHSDELWLAPEQRPPVELRRALDYICSREGNIENAEEVAGFAMIGLRTLQAYFSTWTGMGIARYCKLFRLGRAVRYKQETDVSFTELARLFGFTNVARFKRDVDDYLGQPVPILEPSAFYSNIRTRFESQ